MGSCRGDGGAFGYLMISGAAFATVRSYIMISIMFLAVMLDQLLKVELTFRDLVPGLRHG